MKQSDTTPMRTQVTRFFAIVLTASAALAQPTTAPTNPYRDQLVIECRQLADSLVRRSYGFGCQIEDGANARQPVVGMSAIESPAAAIVLRFAGDYLRDPALREQAHQLSRGAIASQNPLGFVSARPVFGNSPGRTPERAFIIPRQPTLASLAIWLIELDGKMQRDPQVYSATLRAVGWLQKQQAHNGGWPSAQPPDGDPKNAIRILRFDNEDYRDSTIALLFAADVLNDKQLALLAHRSADLLVRARVQFPNHSAFLWPTAAGVDGAALDRAYAFPLGADTLASRYSIQTLIACSALLHEASYQSPIDDAIKALEADRGDDGTWPRFLDPGPAPQISTTQSVRPGVSTQPVVDRRAEAGTFGLDDVIASQQLSQQQGYFSVHEQFAAALCGLLDQPLTWQLPRDEAEARDFLVAHKDDLQRLRDPAPPDPHEKLRRLWLLLSLAKIEDKFGL